MWKYKKFKWISSAKITSIKKSKQLVTGNWQPQQISKQKLRKIFSAKASIQQNVEEWRKKFEKKYYLVFFLGFFFGFCYLPWAVQAKNGPCRATAQRQQRRSGGGSSAACGQQSCLTSKQPNNNEQPNTQHEQQVSSLHSALRELNRTRNRNRVAALASAKGEFVASFQFVFSARAVRFSLSLKSQSQC